MIDIKHCSTDADFDFAVRITKDYLRWLDMDLSFQDIDNKLSDFSSLCGPPQGIFLLAWHNSDLAGGVGLRRFDDDIYEMNACLFMTRLNAEAYDAAYAQPSFNMR
jgi:hypothetical protein